MANYNIVFATDQKYIQHLCVALISLLENNRNVEFDIYIINNGISSTNWKKIELSTGSYACHLINITITDTIFENLVTHHHFTKAMYYRLLIPEFINSDKVLYLDSDIIINASICELYEQNINDYFVGAVENPGFDRHGELGMGVHSKYFNSGVLLVNLKKWKERNLQNSIISFINENYSTVKFPDQDGLNAIIDGNWKKISPIYNQQSLIFETDFEEKYNCFTPDELKLSKENPVIVHYTGTSKPWQFGNKHPYKYLYWKYLKMTKFWPYFPEVSVLSIIKMMIPKKVKEFLKQNFR